jgi:hypothetical protein
MAMNFQKDNSLISPTTNTVFLDIEADGLNPTKVHCVVTKRSNEAHLTHLSRRSLMNEKVDLYVVTILLGMTFLFCTGYGVYVFLNTELWTRWFFLGSFIPIWMVVTASLLGELGLAFLKESIVIGKNSLKRWLSIAREMWMSLTDYMMR